MGQHLGDQAFAGRFRDIVTRITQKIVAEERPEPRIGKVYSIDANSQTAMILFAGETVDNLVKARYAKNMKPNVVMSTTFSSLGYDAPSDIVRVWGKPGSYFILDYYSGGPIPLTSPVTELESPAEMNSLPLIDFNEDGSWRLGHLSGSGGGFKAPYAMVTGSGQGSLASGGSPGTIITAGWNAPEEDGVDFNGANGRMTISVPGRYLVMAYTSFAANGTNGRVTVLWKNGVQYKGRITSASGTINSSGAELVLELRCAAGDYLQISTAQNSGGALTSNSAEFYVRYIGS